MNNTDINKQVVAVMMQPNPGLYKVTLFGADMGRYGTQDAEAIAWDATLHVNADSALDAVRKVGTPDGVVVLGTSVEYLGNPDGEDHGLPSNVVPIFAFKNAEDKVNES